MWHLETLQRPWISCKGSLGNKIRDRYLKHNPKIWSVSNGFFILFFLKLNGSRRRAPLRRLLPGGPVMSIAPWTLGRLALLRCGTRLWRETESIAPGGKKVLWSGRYFHLVTRKMRPLSSSSSLETTNCMREVLRWAPSGWATNGSRRTRAELTRSCKKTSSRKCKGMTSSKETLCARMTKTLRWFVAKAKSNT